MQIDLESEMPLLMAIARELHKTTDKTSELFSAAIQLLQDAYHSSQEKPENSSIQGRVVDVVSPWEGDERSCQTEHENADFRKTKRNDIGTHIGGRFASSADSEFSALNISQVVHT